MAAFLTESVSPRGSVGAQMVCLAAARGPGLLPLQPTSLTTGPGGEGRGLTLTKHLLDAGVSSGRQRALAASTPDWSFILGPSPALLLFCLCNKGRGPERGRGGRGWGRDNRQGRVGKEGQGQHPSPHVPTLRFPALCFLFPCICHFLCQNSRGDAITSSTCVLLSRPALQKHIKHLLGHRT